MSQIFPDGLYYSGKTKMATIADVNLVTIYGSKCVAEELSLW